MGVKAGLYTRLRPLKSHTSMRSIFWLLALLVGLFACGMLLLSHLNLSYSQQAMAELRRDQIEDEFFASLARIDERQVALERHTAALADIGETFYRLALERSETQERRSLRPQLERSLRAHFRGFEGAFGAGVWFEPDVLAASGKTYSAYLTKADGGSSPQPIALVEKSGGYQAQPWFERTLGDDWTVDKHIRSQIYWSPVYFDFVTERAVLTLASPMFDADRNLVGMVTTDWASDQIIDFVSRVEVTENSFSFLNDRNNRNLSSLSRSADPLLEQKIIDAILDMELANRLTTSAGPSGAPSAQSERLQRGVLNVDGRIYELYYATTAAGMVFGAGVPRDEIDSILVPMRNTNYRILITTGSVLFLLGSFLLYRIVQLMRELQASYTDDLTGLPNRSRLLKDLQSRSEACLLIINLDRFQEINSLFGNACGDQVLLTVGEQLAGFGRTYLTTWRVRVYRLLGDEFALLGPVIPEASIRAIAEGLSDFLRKQRVSWERQSLSVDASAGIAYRQFDKGTASRDQLLSQAKTALRLAREQRRNYLIYDSLEQVEKDYEKNLYWAQRLKNALGRDEIVPHFQPIYDNRQGRVCKYECLVRMLDGESVITAGHFIGIANKLRLDRDITCIMIEKSFARFLQEPYDFSINLSYADLVDPAVLELILKHLRESDIGNRVIFEILESDGIENYSEVFHFIEKVKGFGCQIAIDDFGTGYSNFEQLLKLNVDIIKIDGSLIRSLHEDQTAFAVTNGIVQFARTLGIRTVAEFVHSEAVQARVIELGIDFSQGEYFSMPGPTLTAGHIESSKPISRV